MQETLKSRLTGALLTLTAFAFTLSARALVSNTGHCPFKMVLFGGIILPLGLYVLCLAPTLPIPKENKTQFILAALGLFLGELQWYVLTGSWSPTL